MTRGARFLAAAAVATFALAACVANAPAVSAPRHLQVVLRNLAMEPALVAVTPGDTVTWTNRDVVPHTVTADGGAWDSGAIEGGRSWSHVVTRADSAGYVCRFHAGMAARFVRQ